MDNSDISFQCIDADEAIEDNADEESDQVTVTVRLNANGKNVRGRDLDWKDKVIYASAQEYHESPLFTEIKDQYTLKRKHDLEYGESQHFTCKFARRKKYVKCTHEYKIIFPAVDQSVIVQETGTHMHQLDDEYVSTSVGFCWSISATEVVMNGVKASSTPKVILRALRDQGCFPDGVEPTKIQLYNKIAHVKKVCNLAESLDNTHELREKIKQYLEIPENDIESYVAHAKIEDENNDEEVRFVIIFTTKRILRYMKQSNNIHLDCTYRLNWNKFPVCVVGTSNVTGYFFPTMTILTSHEDTRALIEIYSFVHSEGIHPRFRMGDGAPAITKAGEEVFGKCSHPDCTHATRLMCWSHVHRNITPRMKTIGSIDKKVEKDLLIDIQNIQWSCTIETFEPLVSLLEEKYLKNETFSQRMLKALDEFFQYFRTVWVTSKERFWFESANPFKSSNNQGVEGVNKDIKQSQTFRKRLPIGSFIDVQLRMCQEWSLSDSSLLEANREKHLFTQPHGLKLRTNGYEWLQNNKENSSIVKLSAKNVQKTLLENVSTIFAVPSSKTSTTGLSLKDCAKERLKSRFDVSRHSNFDEAMKIRQSCHIIEQVGTDYFCDCHEGIKGRMCIHSVGLMYKCGQLEVTSDVRSKPLGQKRQRGRPKKMPHCLTHSPEPRTVGPIPRALYLPSPNSSIVDVSESQPTTVSTGHSGSTFPEPDNTLILDTPVLHSTFVSSTPAAENPGDPVLNTTFVASIDAPPAVISDTMLTCKSTRKRMMEVEELPPAKRISRKKPIRDFVAPKPPPKKTSLTIVRCDIPPNIFDLEIVSSVAKPRRGRSAKK